MKTDDLQRVLHDLLDDPVSSVELDAANERVDAKVRRHRRRVGVAGAVMVVVLATAITVGVVASRDTDKVGVVTTPNEHPKLVALEKVPSFDAVVVMPRESSLLTLQQVERRFDEASTVTRYGRIAPAVAALNFGSVGVDRCAPLVRWVVELDRAARTQDLAALVLHGEVVERGDAAARWPRLFGVNGFGGADAEVFMNVGATSTQIASVRAALDATPGVDTYRFLNQNDAYREFKRIFADSPDLLASVTPAILPMSFRLDLARGTDPASITAQFEHVDGVWRVVTRDEAMRSVPELVGYPPRSDLPDSALLDCSNP